MKITPIATVWLQGSRQSMKKSGVKACKQGSSRFRTITIVERFSKESNNDNIKVKKMPSNEKNDNMMQKF